MNIKSNFFCGHDLLYLVHRAKEHDEYMDAEVIPDSDQLSSMYSVFVAGVIIATARTPQGRYRSFLTDPQQRRCFPRKSLTRETFTFCSTNLQFKKYECIEVIHCNNPIV